MSRLLPLLWVISILALLLSCVYAPVPETIPATSENTTQAGIAPQASPTTSAYLPMVTGFSGLPPTRRVNTPYFGSNAVAENEAAIFWFGRVNATENYADVRVGYNDSYLLINVVIFDRRLWYNEDPTADPTKWDAVTILLDTSGNSTNAPTATSHRIVGELTWGGPNVSRSPWDSFYQGNGTMWQSTVIPVTSSSFWRGNGPNDDIDDRGWSLEYRIPYSSLGVTGHPSDGTIWGLGVQVHDRDDAAGTPIADQVWPETLKRDQPATWGQLRFGLPTYTPPAVSTSTTITIQNKWQGAVVTDIGAGGTISNQCPGDSNFIWNQWGDANYHGAPRLLIQNQEDVADWPCFAKAFMNFPLYTVPMGKRIVSATLTLYEYGGSDPTQAWPSLVQLFSVRDSWNTATLTWNNAPLAVENVSQAWVDVYSLDPPQWPGAAIVWDVSYALAQAYAAGQPLRLAVYEADTALHSGKYFIGSNEVEEPASRPFLTVIYGSQ